MNSSLLKTLVIYAIILPLAVALGWMAVDLADWDRTSFTVFALVGFVLILPLLLKWHYPVMVFSWAAFITLFFIPGRPALWMLMALVAVSIAIVHRIITKRRTFLSAPAVTFSLLLLGAVILITAWLRGGVGLNILGSSTIGGKNYIVLLASIVGFFGFATRAIPPERAKLYVGLFFLSSTISIVSNLIFFAGPGFYFLYLIFPSGFAGVQAMSETGGAGAISRVAGFSTGAVAICVFLLAIYGVRGLFTKWWRLALFLLALTLGTMGGYRSLIVLIGAFFLILFVMEGLLRSGLFPALLLAGGLTVAVLIPLAPQLPLSMQRTLSILPINVDARVRADASSSLEWRLQIWRALVPDLPKYVWLGKGYTINPTDLYLSQEATLRHRVASHESAVQSGSYHSGPLTLYVPFGSPGVVAFLIFLGVVARSLYLNYQYGDEKLRTINRFLLAYFLGRVLFFFTAFGDFGNEFYMFTGTIGLSVALNHGVCRRPASVARAVVFRPGLRLRTPSSHPV